MKKQQLTLPLVLALMAASAPALAAKANSALGPALSGQALSPAVTAVTSSTIAIDVTGRNSVDGPGAEGNDVLLVDIGPGTEVLGIGWDVSITAIPPSWQSEMALRFGSSSTPFVNLRPGTGVDESGTAAYSSGGIIDLVGLSLNFSVDGDGILRLEFFESFDDVAGAIDGTWDSGTITLQISAVPEPTTYGMMALGLLGVAAAARRRRKA